MEALDFFLLFIVGLVSLAITGAWLRGKSGP
jgi:hypothetical protein